jgi:hypothetical protein
MPTVTTPPSAAANSYTTAAFADAYLATRPAAQANAWAALGAAAREAALIAATTVLEAYSWVGVKSHTITDNALAWPRSYVYNRDGQQYPSNVIPAPVQQACAELAYLIATGAVGANGAAAVASAAALTSVTVGDISVSYDPERQAATTGFNSGYSSTVDLLIAPFVETRAPAARLTR